MSHTEAKSRQAGPLQDDKFAPRPLVLFLAPRYWGLWIALGVMRATTVFPYAGQVRIGKAFGKLMHATMRKRRLIANRNIELCFPEVDRAGRVAMVRDHFESLGLSLVEMALGWWASNKKIQRLMTVEGMEHLDAALSKGKGAILVTAHFTSVEASGRMFAKLAPPFLEKRPQHHVCCHTDAAA